MRYLLSLILALFLVSPVVAAQKASAPDEAPAAAEDESKLGGFEGPVSGAQAETVAAAIKMSQDARVVVTGHIASRVAGENNEYIFRDGTGEMAVRITPRQFKGNRITPATKVQLIGKIDKTGAPADSVRLRVSSLEVLK